jgi:predicted nuclease of predicted toxin-antitoxin system
VGGQKTTGGRGVRGCVRKRRSSDEGSASRWVKIKLDEVVQVLASYGHNVRTVWDEGLVGRKDQEIWIRCQHEDRLLITQDLDFSDLRKFQPGSHTGIMLVRLQHPGRVELLNQLPWIFGTHDVESWNRCFVIVSDTN